jgi:hypothetical protein
MSLSSALAALDWNRPVDRSSYGAADMPPYPARPFLIHLAWKGLQFGSVAGLAATGVVTVARRVPLASAWRGCMPVGGVVGTVLTFGMVGGKAMSGGMDVAGVDDRGYRLSRSASQLAVDECSAVGGAVGAAAGAILGQFALRSVVASGLTGVAAGVGWHVGHTMALPALRKRGLLPPAAGDE